MIQQKWDKRFLKLAMYYADWSKDPSTKCGAIIADLQNRIISTGYNGMAQGVDEGNEIWEDREVKYEHVIHAEVNALIFAGRSIRNGVLYTVPIQPCSRCASLFIQAGILRVVSIKDSPDEVNDRWRNSLERARLMYNQSGVSLTLYTRQDVLDA